VKLGAGAHFGVVGKPISDFFKIHVNWSYFDISSGLLTNRPNIVKSRTSFYNVSDHNNDDRIGLRSFVVVQTTLGHTTILGYRLQLESIAFRGSWKGEGRRGEGSKLGTWD